MIPPRVLVWLVTAGIALPIGISVLAGVARLLTAMGDAVGGAVVDRLALAAGLVWVVVLITLVLVLGLSALLRPIESRQPADEIDMLDE